MTKYDIDRVEHTCRLSMLQDLIDFLGFDLSNNGNVCTKCGSGCAARHPMCINCYLEFFLEMEES